MEVVLGLVAVAAVAAVAVAVRAELARRAAVAAAAEATVLDDEALATVKAKVETATRRTARAQRELEHLAWVTAVDARAPAASAHGHLTTLRRTRGEFLEQRERHLLDSAISDLELGLRLLEEVEAWVRSHGRSATAVDVSAREVLDAALIELDHDGRATLDVETLPRVHVDPDLLARALHALLDNCVRYRWPDRPVHIRISASQADDGTVVIDVEDDGLGVDLDDAERLFLPFVRGDGAAAMPGVGLGLARARHAVEACGGSIAFVGHDGRGTTVRLTLPAAIE